MPVSSIWDIPSVDKDGGGGGGGGGAGGYTSTGVPQRASVWSEGIYHEQQEGMMCAKHAINNLLQNREFDEVSLGDIGRKLDHWEKAASGAMQGDGGNSNNVRADGYFGIQVISKALEAKGLTMRPIGSEDSREAKQYPERQDGFIINHGDHWYAVRRLGRFWFDLNSTQGKPTYIGEGEYVKMLLQSLEQMGKSVFVVTGSYPYCKLAMDDAKLAKAVAAHNPAGGGGAGEGGGAFSGAGHTLRGDSGGGGGGGGGAAGGAAALGAGADEDPELAAAIAASLGDAGAGAGASMPSSTGGGGWGGAAGAGGAGGGAAAGSSEDADLAAAIAASMADVQPAGKRSAEGPSASGGQPDQEEMRRRRLARFGGS